MTKKSLLSRLKMAALAGVTLGAGLVGCKEDAKNPDARPEPKTKIVHKVEHQYESKAGVLMPLEGESKAEYVTRLQLIQAEEAELNAKMRKHTQRQLEELLAKDHLTKSERMRADRLVAELKTADRVLMSYYSPEGQRKLAAANKVAEIPSRVVRGRDYDF